MKLHIELVIDLVCPWCFVGTRRLSRAMAQLKEKFPDVEMSYRWLPYFLNLSTPSEGESYQAFMAAKFGSAAQVKALQDRVSGAAQESDLHFAFDRITLRPNTLRAHRLIHRAQALPLPGAVVWQLVDRLFSAYFQNGEDIGDPLFLANVASEFGDDRAAVLEYLAGEEGVAEVLALSEHVLSWGVGGVPFFVFNEAHGVAGAQSVSQLLNAMEETLLSSSA